LRFFGCSRTPGTPASSHELDALGLQRGFIRFVDH
jgi:hypothetical protein